MISNYLGLFLTSLAAFMLEMLFTRVFSVAAWQYLAVSAASAAMFGCAAGALIVYLMREYFTDGFLYDRLSIFALLFGIFADLALMVFLSIPFYPRFSGIGIFSTAFVYLMTALPFVCAGVVISLCLTRFTEKTGECTGAVMAGAGIGAFMVSPVLKLMDAPTAIFLAGAAGSLGAIFFARPLKAAGGEKRLYLRSGLIFFLLTVIMLGNFFYKSVRVEWVKGRFSVPDAESWNAFSRVAVYPLKYAKEPYSLGLSRTYEADRLIPERMLEIDGASETAMTGYGGNPETSDHLKYDISSIAHYLRSDAKVFIAGVGGGRDILTAKAFEQANITGAEPNDRLLQIVNYRFGNFTGHLNWLPGVKIINDDVRSVMTRTEDKFDIIHASDMASRRSLEYGAFSFEANGLYTVEGFNVMMERLSQNGLLSFTAWYDPEYPAQHLRLASIASFTLQKMGYQDPGKHIAVVRSAILDDRMPSATIIIGKSQFSDDDMADLKSAADALEFKFEYDPAGYKNTLFSDIIANAGNGDFHKTTKIDLTPPTDDRPFFYSPFRTGDLLPGKGLHNWRGFNEGAIIVFMLTGGSALALLFILGPLLDRSRAPIAAGPYITGLLFFASTGLGSVLSGAGVFNRLAIFLGKPVYSITIVASSLLLSSGIGAFFSGRWVKGGIKRSGVLAFTGVVVALLVFIIHLQTGILAEFERNDIAVRITVALLFLIPLGFFMGVHLPFGLSVASRSLREHTPWFLAIGFAAGAVGPLLAACISATMGFTMTLKAGLWFYTLAAFSLAAFNALTVRAESKLAKIDEAEIKEMIKEGITEGN